MAAPSIGSHGERLRVLASDYGFAERLELRGYVTRQQLADIIRGARALLYPSLYEGFGLPVLEAMACGTPVITSNCSSLPEVAGDAARLVDPISAESIGQAIVEVATNDVVWQQLQQRGLVRAQQFSWKRTAVETLAIYEEVLAETLKDGRLYRAHLVQ